MRAHAAAILALLIIAVAGSGAATSRPSARAASGTAQRRAAHLRRGINLSRWFAGLAEPSAYTKQHFETAITSQDIGLIRAMGFDHVRLSVDPRPMFSEHEPDRISSDYLAELDAALKMLLEQNLAVEIDIYADAAFKNRLTADDEFVEEFADFWRALASHWSSLDPDRVFFEILNEPGGKDRYRWYGIEAKLSTVIREGAPQHTIIATGANWSDDDELVFLEPLRDPNIIYAFHFYEPHVFTHQGATWSTNYWHSLKGVPYPSNPENVAPVMAELSDPVHRLTIERYGMDRWNAERIEGEISQAAAWAGRWDVPVLCNEFGVYRKNADPGDRARWISDVRTSLEKHQIGWAMWDYDGGFDVVNRKDGKTLPDEATLRALGLALPRAPN